MGAPMQMVEISIRSIDSEMQYATQLRTPALGFFFSLRDGMMTME